MRVDAQEEFWNWFREHEQELWDFEKDRERIFDELASELRKVDADLTFEFGPKSPRREFVVSAGGIRRAFSAVSSLVAAAPTLDRWRVMGFRPRRSPLNVIEFQDKRVHPNEVQFSLLDDGKTPGIYLFIPGYKEGDATLKQIGYLLLDDALGEYDVESSLGLVKMFSPETATEGERYPFPKLPTQFDQLISQLGRNRGSG